MEITLSKIKKQVKELDSLFGIKSDDTLLEQLYSTELPTTYPYMNKKDTQLRITELVTKISRDTATDDEMEEYGWRIINQPRD